MGFLMHIPGTPARWWIALPACSLLAACSGLRIAAPAPVEPDDWPMAGRTILRSGMTPERITPPLIEEWRADINAGAGPTALAVVDSFLYISTLRGELIALNTRTGRHLGHVTLGPALPGAPAMGGGHAYVGVSNAVESIIAFDLDAGKTSWKHPLGDVEGSPLLIGNRLYAGNTAGAFVCLSAPGGENIWTYRIPDNRKLKGIRGAPASDSTRVFFTSDDGAVYALDADSGRVVWRCTTAAAFRAGPAVADTLVVAGNTAGTVSGIGRKSGMIRWTYDAGAAVFAAAAAADSMVFIGTAAGRLHALRVTDGRPVWIAHCGDALDSAPVVCDGTVFVGTLSRELVAVSLATGDVLWRGPTDGRIKTQPVVAKGMIFVATDERQVIAFREEGRR
jgi:outer membrane protein assembly factor BamB